MKKVRVGIIGGGAVVEKRHAPEYTENPNAEIAAFYDINTSRAQFLVDKFGGKVAKSYEDIINDPTIDAVSVCTPNNTHAAISIAAMRTGKHVLCEKPMAISSAEAKDILDVQKETGKIFMMGHNQRFTKAHILAKEIIASKKLGKIITFRTVFGHGGPESWSVESKNTWFFRKDKCEFGVLGDLGAHKLDLIRFLTDDEFQSVYSVGGVLHKTFEDGSPIEVCDNGIATLRMKNGAIGTGTFSWTFYGEEDNSTVLYLEKGIIRIYADPKYQVIVIHNDGNIEKYETDAIQTNDNQTKSGVIDAFIETIIDNKPSPVSAFDGLQSIKIIDAIMESFEVGKEVVLG
ncbi:MAG: Gfo/Idh/MocA family oxidoreductase [Fusobacteriaceae bacterium]|jgi:predicted dehydrogenase|nr:Gfo/Idh/MocA family oxidoreductase [Fusobacteriaceae bacterium]